MNNTPLLAIDLNFSSKRSLSFKILSELKEKKQYSIYRFIAYEMLILSLSFFIGSFICFERYFRFRFIGPK
jgi:hypothetical protein